MDTQSVYSTHVYEPSVAETGDTRQQIQTQLETFVLDFRLDNHFVYRYVTAPVMTTHWLTILSDQLRENALLQKYYCDVNITDLINFNEELAHKLASEPAEIIPLVGARFVFKLAAFTLITRL